MSDIVSSSTDYSRRSPSSSSIGTNETDHTGFHEKRQGASSESLIPPAQRSSEESMPAPKLFPKLTSKPNPQLNLKDTLNKRVSDRLQALELNKSFDFSGTPRPMHPISHPLSQHKTPEFKHRKRNVESILTPKNPSLFSSSNAASQRGSLNTAPSNFAYSHSSSLQTSASSRPPVLSNGSFPRQTNTAPLNPPVHLKDNIRNSATPSTSQADIPIQYPINSTQKQQAKYEAEIEGYKAKLAGTYHEISVLQNTIVNVSGQLIAVNDQLQQLRSGKASTSPSTKDTNMRLVEGHNEETLALQRGKYTQEEVDKLIQERMEKVAEDLHAQYSAKHTQKINAFKANYARKYEATIQELQNQIGTAPNAPKISNSNWEEERRALKADNQTLQKQLEKAIQERQDMSDFLNNFKADMAKSDKLLMQQQSQQTGDLETLRLQLQALQEELRVEREERQQLIQMSEDLVIAMDQLNLEQKS